MINKLVRHRIGLASGRGHISAGEEIVELVAQHEPEPQKSACQVRISGEIHVLNDVLVDVFGVDAYHDSRLVVGMFLPAVLDAVKM